MSDLCNPLDSVDVPVPMGMLDEVSAGYKEVDGIVVSRGWHHSLADRTDDETGIECMLSKMHIDDFVPEQTPLCEMVRIGVAYAHVLQHALSTSLLKGCFHVIVSASAEEDESIGNTCVLRFHRLRLGQVWLVDDLEAYKQPIITLEFCLD